MATEESQDVGGNPDHITVGLGLRLGESTATRCVGDLARPATAYI